MTENRGFKPIKQLIYEAWEILTKKWRKFLGFWAAMLVIVFIYALAVLILFGLGFSGQLLRGSNLGLALAGLNAARMLVVVIVFVGLSLALVFYLTAVSAGMSLMVVDQKNLSVGDLIKKGLTKVIPMIIVGFLSFLLIVGGLGALVIPGIVMGVVLIFVNLEVILADKKSFQAIKGSYQIVKQNFIDLLFRYLLIWGGMMLITMILETMSDSRYGVLVFPFILARLLWSIISSMLMVIISVLIYQEARNKTDFNKQAKLGWMYIISGLGWILMIIYLTLIINSGAKFIKETDWRGVLNSARDDDYEFTQDFDQDNWTDYELDSNYDEYLYD